MLEQLQQTFPEIDKEIISDALKWFKQDIEMTKNVLAWLTENATSFQQQHHLLTLFKHFGSIIEKTILSQIWNNYNQIFVDTYYKLQEICATSNLNELKEEKELKILREMCLHILWNILKYPKHIKYRQIHKQALYNYLLQKCHTLGADFEYVFLSLEKNLEIFGFKKENNDNWYYQYHHIQLLHLWKCYQAVIIYQIMYVVNKTMI
ncbi:hypothetical protein RFI_04961 [Reticulomyxa filosa]|uniref:CUE domain-containing protein n=1 Tax=Reticulomyxa filosa TaxID=46433 RepID=X6P1N3_RETFI|nr:hypothetical protein RFI_04961 [Reticulomyxa filosa]|eukprot:ETO32156.1 hypothetical protein RFI_04961 [Reticulomyxa filosa]